MYAMNKGIIKYENSFLLLFQTNEQIFRFNNTFIRCTHELQIPHCKIRLISLISKMDFPKNSPDFITPKMHKHHERIRCHSVSRCNFYVLGEIFS